MPEGVRTAKFPEICDEGPLRKIRSGPSMCAISGTEGWNTGKICLPHAAGAQVPIAPAGGLGYNNWKRKGDGIAMRADELLARFRLEPHVEGGSFRELDALEGRFAGRAPSGAIYYYLGAEEHSEFHVLDSDEYWLWHAGSTLEVWEVDGDGGMRVRCLGLEEGAEPCVLLPAGTIFGARHLRGAVEDGTLVSCVTAPRFSYEHYRILPRAEMLEKYPASAAFYAD